MTDNFDIDIDHDPDVRAIRNIRTTDLGFEATLHLPGHVYSEVAEFVDTLHDENFLGAEWVIESFALDADGPSMVTLAFNDAPAPSATSEFTDALRALFRVEFADSLDPALFDEWQLKNIRVSMDGVTVHAEFPEPVGDDDEDYMVDDHPAFEHPSENLEPADTADTVIDALVTEQAHDIWDAYQEEMSSALGEDGLGR